MKMVGAKAKRDWILDQTDLKLQFKDWIRETVNGASPKFDSMKNLGRNLIWCENHLFFSKNTMDLGLGNV